MSKMVTYGKITSELDLRYMSNEKHTAVLDFSVVEKKSGSKDTQFLNFTAIGATAENIAKYFRKLSRIVVYSHPDNQEYTNKEGHKVRLTKFIVESFEFVDTKAESEAITTAEKAQPAGNSGFMDIPDDVTDEGLPFN